MEEPIYAEVIVNVPHRRVDRLFHYQIPEELRFQIQAGHKIEVSFGNRQVEGIVVNITDRAPAVDLKMVEKIIDVPPLPQDLLALARWIADVYVCPYIDALNTVYPTKTIKRRRRKKTTKTFPESLPFEPSVEQGNAIKQISSKMAEGKSATVLLQGVTGSGKTEVYLQAIDEVLGCGKQAIVLVPEIALTPQIEERFLARFGDRVAVMHSRLSDGERSEAWRRIRDGEVGVAVGARSAIFAPFSRIGLIIIDEEHEFSYKQEDNPKYHTRDVAAQRAKWHNAVVVLGTATPSIESYYLAQQGVYSFLTLPRRIHDRPMPEVNIVDMREELRLNNRSMFSRSLHEAIGERLTRGEQSIILLNRRGFATFVLCRDCGFVVRCPHCSVSLTYHSSDKSMRCHYCQFRSGTPDTCPACRSHRIRYFGAGTQKVEDELRTIFPEARILRMDSDTTTRKNSHQQILAAFERGDADILLGTQMIAKGLDYPNVTLVGVVAADTALNLPDFRSAERTFQLLTQAAGRAGRGDKSGQVIIQTYNPENYSIKAVQTQDYAAFYREEIAIREELCYPPFHSLIKIVISGDDEREVIHRLENVLGDARQCAESRGIQMEFLGPSPAPLNRIKDQFRWQLFLKGPDKQLLHTVLIDTIDEATFGSGGLSIDVDPVSML